VSLIVSQVRTLVQNTERFLREYWHRWRADLEKDAELYRAVAAKMAKFLGMGDKVVVETAVREWRKMVTDNKKALFKWKYASLVAAFTGLRDLTRVERENRQLLARIRKKFDGRETLLLLRLWRAAAEDIMWAQHLIVHMLWRYETREIALPFDAMLEHAQLQIKARHITQRFAALFKLRAARECLNVWAQEAAEEAERKRKTKQLLFRLKNRAAHDCFETWKAAVQDAKIKLREGMCANSAALARWLKRPMVNCFLAYKEYVETEKAHRAKIRKMLYRIQNACVVHTFESWIDFLGIMYEEKRAHLKLAVAEALHTGSLAVLLQMAKSQPKAYRELLDEVRERERAHQVQERLKP